MLARRGAGARSEMNKLIAASPLPVLVGAILWLPFCPERSAALEQGADASQLRDQTQVGHGLPAGGKVFFASPDFSRRATLLTQPSRIVLRSTGINPSTGLGERYSRTYSLSYQPIDVVGVTANDFIIYGVDPLGVPIFERWVLDPDGGTYFSHRTLPTTGVGTSVPLGVTTVRILGDYTSPSKMDNIEPALAREQVHRGGAIGNVVDMAVDPEGRFILVISDDSDGLRRIWQIHLNEDVDPTALITEVEFPSLLLNGQIEARLSASQGFYWLLSGDTTYSVIWDPDYDGVIDSVGTIESGDYFDLFERGGDNIPLMPLFVE